MTTTLRQSERVLILRHSWDPLNTKRNVDNLRGRVEAIFEKKKKYEIDTKNLNLQHVKHITDE